MRCRLLRQFLVQVPERTLPLKTSRHGGQNRSQLKHLEQGVSNRMKLPGKFSWCVDQSMPYHTAHSQSIVHHSPHSERNRSGILKAIPRCIHMSAAQYARPKRPLNLHTSSFAA